MKIICFLLGHRLRFEYMARIQTRAERQWPDRRSRMLVRVCGRCGEVLRI